MSGPTPPTTDPAPEPRPLQFTLRSMFVVMTALALLLGLVIQLGCFGVLLFGLLACIVIAVCKRNWWYVLPAFGIAILLALTMFPISAAREAAHRAYCYNNLKQITIALHNYHDMYGSFPPAYIADADGKPMHSWRVLVLPFIQKNDLLGQYRFDEPWNGPNNRKLHDLMPNMFRCPSEADTNMTSYVAVVGPGTAWPDGKSTKLKDFADGAFNTLLVVEVADSGIHWMEPRDLHVLQMNPKLNSKSGQGISSNHPGTVCVAFADDSIHVLPDDLPPETIKAMLTIDGGEKVSPEDWE